MPRLLRFIPGGLNEVFVPGGATVETHSSTCSHCQRQTDFPSLRTMFEYVDICRGCMKLICQDCAGNPCRPYEKEAERLENEEYLKKQLAMQGWGCY